MDQGFGKKVMHTAMVIIPPVENCTQIQKIRSKHDKQINRWMPHINMAFPFFDMPDFERAAKTLQEALKDFPAFEIKFRKFAHFEHAKQCIIYMQPETDQVVQLFQEVKKVFPQLNDLELKGEHGFTPHLTVGQFSKNETAKCEEEFQKNWQDEIFECRHLHLIHRSGQDAPFKIIHSVNLKSDNNDVTSYIGGQVQQQANFHRDLEY